MNISICDDVGLYAALYRLLHSRTDRHRFLAGDLTGLDLTESQQRELETIDHIELETTAKSIARALLKGNAGGGGGLQRSYPITFDVLAGEGFSLMELMFRFLDSSSFSRYCEITTAGRGLCAEEAFYCFLINDDDLLSLHPLTRWALTHEMLLTMLSLLVVNRNPAFEIASNFLRDNPACNFAVYIYPSAALRALNLDSYSADARAPVPYLYAATAQRLIHGPISPMTAELLELGNLGDIQRMAQALGNRHGAPPREVKATARRLVEKGLIA